MVARSFIHSSIYFYSDYSYAYYHRYSEEKKDKWFVCFQKSGLFCECLCARFSLES